MLLMTSKIEHSSILTLMVMEKIEGDDDILTAILVRLPPKYLFRFRCVSKRWNNIVKDHFFIQSYEARKREERLSSKLGLLSIIKQRTHVIFREIWYIDFPPNDRFSYGTNMKITPLSLLNNDVIKAVVPERFGNFIHSSNGLILGNKQYYHRQYPDVYYILNPVARTWVYLPPPPRVYKSTSLGLTCEESTMDLVQDYKVVQAGIPMSVEVEMPIQTYSSRTRSWTNAILVGTGEFRIPNFVAPLVFNGVFHWLFCRTGLAIAIYDSTGAHENHVQLVLLPYDDQMIFSSGTVTRSFSDDVLWFGVEIKDKSSQFWMLPNKDEGYWRAITIPKKEWILMHTINHDSLHKELVWLIPGNPLVAILRFRNRIFLYDLETKSMESVLPIDGHIAALEKVSYYCDIYMEPLSLSSFALSADTYYYY